MSEKSSLQDELSSSNFYAVIPSAVLYDSSLRPNAKIIYAAISCFCNMYGSCVASNSHFSQAFGLSVKTISELINSLVKAGYITSEMVRDKNENGAIDLRKITLNVSFKSSSSDCSGGIPKNVNTPPEKSGEGIPKNVKGNNININNNTPIVPKGTDTLNEYFEKFWSAYPRKIAKQKARRAFEKLKPDEDLLRKMLKALEEHKKSSQWTKDNGEFIPHPASWLNGRRWEDETTNTANNATVTAERKGVQDWG